MLQKISKTWRISLFVGFLFLCYIAFSKIQTHKDEFVRSIAYKRKINHIRTPSANKVLAAQLKCKDKTLEMQRVQHGSYWLIQNIIRGSISQSIGCADSITYATNGDYTFFWALSTVVKRWHAPVSFAIFAPGYDFGDTMLSIQYVRNCLPESVLIQQYVTFHIYFPVNHMPKHVPLNENEALQWPYHCEFPPYRKGNNKTTYRKTQRLNYPINVGRNIARKAANTYFVFTCDIELYPSPGFVDKFLQMIAHNISLVIDAPEVKKNPRVFVLNIYELKKKATIPNSKKELRNMLKTNMAIRFHSTKCPNCHRIPYEQKWLSLTSVNEMEVIGISKRLGRHKVWEPFYISDNKEPIFDERVHWEGQSNKRVQGFAMCLLDYDYYILNDGFLVHSPGIKYGQARKAFWSMNYMINYNFIHQYKRLYGENIQCHV